MRKLLRGVLCPVGDDLRIEANCQASDRFGAFNILGIRAARFQLADGE